MTVGDFVLHLHPASIKTHALRPSFTWCMGGITFFLFLVEAITGVLLMFYYRPTIEWAYHDMLDLRDVVSFGVLRGIHRWGGHAMVITVMLHMYRVFLTGSYKPPRDFNWCVGVLLLVLTLAFSFTGYLLPWDQLSLWAVTVGANLAGDARFLLLARDRRRGHAEPLLRIALPRPAAGGDIADGDSFLARKERRHQRTTVEKRREDAAAKHENRYRQPVLSRNGVRRLVCRVGGAVSWPPMVCAACRGGNVAGRVPGVSRRVARRSVVRALATAPTTSRCWRCSACWGSSHGWRPCRRWRTTGGSRAVPAPREGICPQGAHLARPGL